jgi:hypothetical protein
VHLTDWPDVTAASDGSGARVCSSVLTLREVHRRRTRLPLKTLTVAHPEAMILERYGSITAESVNVKEMVFTSDVAAFGSRTYRRVILIGGERHILYQTRRGATRCCTAIEGTSISGRRRCARELDDGQADARALVRTRVPPSRDAQERNWPWVLIADNIVGFW